MRDTRKMKYQANEFYYGYALDDEDEETPHTLEHITSEKIYIDYIMDTDDDEELELKRKGVNK